MIDPVRLLDIILLGVIAEAVLLTAWLRRSGYGHAAAPLLLFLFSGGALILAVRCVAAGTGPEWTLLLLLAISGVGHGTCLWLCLRNFLRRS